MRKNRYIAPIAREATASPGPVADVLVIAGGVLLANVIMWTVIKLTS